MSTHSSPLSLPPITYTAMARNIPSFPNQPASNSSSFFFFLPLSHPPPSRPSEQGSSIDATVLSPHHLASLHMNKRTRGKLKERRITEPLPEPTPRPPRLTCLAHQQLHLEKKLNKNKIKTNFIREPRNDTSPHARQRYG